MEPADRARMRPTKSGCFSIAWRNSLLEEFPFDSPGMAFLISSARLRAVLRAGTGTAKAGPSDPSDGPGFPVDRHHEGRFATNQPPPPRSAASAPGRSTPPSTVRLHNSGTVPVRRTAPPATSGHTDFRDCPRRSLPLRRELLISREPLMHMAPVARVCHQMLRLRLGRGNG